MAYTINSAKDSRGDEQEFMDDFVQNQAAIETYKRTRGGSYEDAYQAVTGKPWPEGRSVKVKDGQAEMTKDRTVKSVVGKYVLPAAAAALTGGAALGVGPLAGMMGGAAGSLGSAGAVGSAPAFVPTSLIGTGLGAGGSFAAPVAAAGSGGGFLSGLLGGAKKLLGGGQGGDVMSNLLGAAGRGISGATQASATNRGVGLDAAMEQERLRQSGKNLYETQLINRSADDRDSLTDAFTKSVQAQRVLNSKGYQTPMISQMPGAKPTALANFGTGMQAPTDAMKGDAQALYDEVSKRLKGGSQLPALQAPTDYTNDPALLKPTGGERIGNWLGPALNIFGAQPQVMPRNT